ncbi:hypothetical protein SKAU_G00240420 [Synaphobranchus kaupii]|uniref:Uncharacterized protein n=1 Tax=Synaphobranchus kaupii TaxID=118154 RepID=A0A9Q1F7W5_SYNKA|nr:hypothetical protein SKAU_G00240420 [Synaphobranchus kaupii]
MMSLEHPRDTLGLTNRHFRWKNQIRERASLFIPPGCRYVARKIRAAISGEEQPEKPRATCSVSKAWKGEGSQGEGSRQEPLVRDPGFEPEPEGRAPDRSVEECRS